MPGLWSEATFTAFLSQGLWHAAVDDNVQGECLTAELIRDIVTRYRAHPNDPSAQQEVGLFALAMGVAEWGVSNPAGLPTDPAGKNWQSDTGPDSGKHLMSYAIGGIGISHADVGDLTKFIEDVAVDPGIVPQQHSPALLRLADRSLYLRHKVIYDEIRAAGVCSTTVFPKDLNGEPFKHFVNIGAGDTYCKNYSNGKLNAKDWQVFRTWMRAALRTRAKQEWLAALWMDKYWTPSLQKVPSGPGYIEEVIVNARVRNSAPAVANQAVLAHAATPAERVQRELDAYGAWNPNTLRRRCRLMLRPVLLYRHFAGEEPLQGIKCPPQH